VPPSPLPHPSHLRIKPLGRRRFALVSLLLAWPLLAPGCRAADGLAWPVPPPPAVRSDQPLLWVGLAAHLGSKPSAAPLLLESVKGPLELVDAKGQRLLEPSLKLVWRSEPLASPLRISRTVLGPFPSYEAASLAADRWRQQGVAVVIAHPADWEVWAPPRTAAPAGLKASQLSLRLVRRTALAVQGPKGTVALQGPISLRAPAGLRWDGGVFKGPFRLQGDAYGSWTLVEVVPLERYLLGVVPHEIGAGAPGAALSAQAILARTWALRNRQRFIADGYHLCADTQCQVYGDPGQASSELRRAVAATNRQLLTWRDQPIHAVYHASNGGVSAGFEEAWGGVPLPYLQAFADGPAPFRQAFALPLTKQKLQALLRQGEAGYGADHPRYRWQRQLSAAQVGQALGSAGTALGAVRRLVVLERGASGRVLALSIQGTKGSLVLRRDAIRRALRQLPSTLFVVQPAGAGLWTVLGGGFGHGAGLSQAGAIDLARRGWSVARILEHYYPGTALVPIEALKQGL
jgi:SpoIID/LytB domain protein